MAPSSVMAARGDARTPTLFFAFTALLHLAGVLSRFDRIYEVVPDYVHASLLCGQLPLLLVEGYFLDRCLRSGRSGFPAWMELPSGPVRWSLALAVTYIGLFVLQTWSIELGVVDPTPPEVWPDAQRLAWFVGFAVVASFPAYLFATKAMLPVLRVLVWPLRRLPVGLALLLAAAAGGGLSLLALSLVDADKNEAFQEIASLVEALRGHPLEGLLMTLGGPLLSGGVGAVRERLGRGRRGEPGSG